MRGGVATRALFATAALVVFPAAPAGAASLPTGRPVAPAGRVTALQAFPTGVAAAPDGKTVLAIGGRVGEPYEISPWEYYFGGFRLRSQGKPEAELALLDEGLAQHPRHGAAAS